jgi:hypothetical protein
LKNPERGEALQIAQAEGWSCQTTRSPTFAVTTIVIDSWGKPSEPISDRLLNRSQLDGTELLGEV